jgi:hypothetical protein
MIGSTGNNTGNNEEEEFYGDSGDNKLTHDLRVTLININVLPESNSHPKNDQIYQATQSTQTDILLMNETGKCWHKIREKNKWHARTRPWWESSKSTIAYNTQDICHTAYQPGGCIITSIDRASHRVLNCGNDERKLGRWTWQRFSGKRGITLLVICAYRPCKPSTAGPNTVYSQHQRLLDTIGINTCPRQCILDDLGTFIDENRKAGDQIILGMDCNDDVTSDTWQSWLRKRGLRNGIIRPQDSSPSTYHKGSYPIDGIFVSPTIIVKQSGYHPFGTFPSDHRSLWVDVSYSNAFGYQMNRIVIPRARRLKTGDPRIVKKFNSEYTKFIKQHKLHTKIFQIERDMGTSLTPSQAREYDFNLAMRNKGMLLAEKRCRKLRMGLVPYSEEINIARMTIQLWRAVILKKKGCRFSNNKLRRLERSTGITNSLHFSLEEAKQRESTAFAQYKKLKKTADQRRLTYLEDKATAIAQDTTLTTTNVYKQLIKREEQRSSARRIKHTIGKLKVGGVTKVEVLNKKGEIEDIITKEGIEKACMVENDIKFLQTSETPLMKGQLAKDFGFDALTTAGQAVLDGHYHAPSTTPQYTRELLQHLEFNATKHKSPQAHISSSMFSDGWRKMKEQTSAGISGIHFGHFKSCAADKFLTEYESSLSHIPFATGYSPPQWQVGVNVMIRKKAQVDLVTGLRTVVLTEADFNFNNKILGRMTLQHAEMTGALAKEQYGSRKGKKAIDQAIHKRLTYDILRQMRAPGALCSNDAKSCYDRIVHSVAMLAYQRLGIPSPPVRCMLHTIQNMKHHIRTTFGDSAFTMSNEGSLIPYQGALQGNGASPATWVVISTPLLNMMRSAGNGGVFVEPISGKVSHTVGFAFVDDTDLIELDLREHITTAQTMTNMQAAIQRWEGGLKATGGAIVPAKSWVYPISFVFNSEGKWKYETVREIGANFSVKDHNEDTLPLPQHDPHIGKETLGVILAPDGNNQAMVESMIAKATEWRDYVQTGFLTAQDAHQALHTTILKTLQYPLPALTLTEKECDKIMSPILEVGLPAMSVCKRYPRKVVYAPKKDGGLNIPNLYISQGTSRIAFLQEHLGADTLSGELLRVTIEAAKVEVGIGRDLFQLEYDRFHMLLTDTWIKEVWRFSTEHSITITDHVTMNVDLQRDKDLYLMEIFSQQQFTPAEMQHINRVRLYLQVTTLSDIMCGYGRSFQQAYRLQKQTDRPKRCKWPQQPKPGKRSITLWRKALRICFPRDIEDVYNIGQWLSNGHIEGWKWYYNGRTQFLYERDKERWKIWKRMHQRGTLGTTPTYTYYNQALRLPPNSDRATISPHKCKQIKLTGWYQHSGLPLAPHRPFHYDRGTTQDSSILTDELKQLYKDSLLTGPLRLVSDGSYDPTLKLGTASWVIESQHHQFQLRGNLITPGEADVQCSHRSELSGILGGIQHMNEICKSIKIDSGQAIMGCDGEGAIIMISASFEKINSTRKHFDLLGAIGTALKVSPIQWKFHHIKGHQDDVMGYNELTRDEQLNVLVDELAKRKLKQFSSTVNWRYRRPINISYAQCSVDWTNQFGTRVRISSHLQKTLQGYIQSVRAREYWNKKKSISPYYERHIDWTLSEKSHLSMDTHRHRWLSKWLTGFCGVGIMLQRYRHQNHSDCPRCGVSGETTAHIIQCQESGAKSLWRNGIKSLEGWMLDNQGHPEMTRIICRQLQNWQMKREDPHLTPSEGTLILACQQQQKIGWFNFIQGFLSLQWRVCQAEHLIRTKSKKSAILWMSRFQKRLFQIVWDLWDHRNKLLHGAGDRMHPTSLRNIDEDIQSEWNRNLDTLPSRYANLFTGTIDKILNFQPNEKKRWLTSIWAARDKLNGGIQIWDRNSILDYDKWKAKRSLPSKQHAPGRTPRAVPTKKPTLTITINISSDEESTDSDNDSIQGLGNTPKASYTFSRDTNTLTTTCPSSLSHSSPSSAQSPTGAPLHRHLVYDYIKIPISDCQIISRFRNQPIPPSCVVSTFLHQSVTFRSLLTTLPETWLNDEIINFYLSVLNHRDAIEKQGSTQKRHHFFNSFFLTRLMDEGHTNRYKYRNVMRWSRRVHQSDLFQLDKIFFPCNISQSHWSCVIVTISTCSIQYFDSMLGNGDRYMHHILHYLQDDWLRTKGFEMPNLRQWTMQNNRDVPTQTNSYDCGVFVCLFATCMAFDWTMNFTQSDMPSMRMKLAHLVFTNRVSNLDLAGTTNSSSAAAIIDSAAIDPQTISQDNDNMRDISGSRNHISQPTGESIMPTTLNTVKRKFNFPTLGSRKKRSTIHSSSQDDLSRPPDSNNTQQLKITDLISRTITTKRKRKMSITDEEHPFKHKRFKSKEPDKEEE